MIQVRLLKMLSCSLCALRFEKKVAALLLTIELAIAGWKRLKAKVALNVPTDDLTHVLTNDDELPWLERLVSIAQPAPAAAAT